MKNYLFVLMLLLTVLQTNAEDIVLQETQFGKFNNVIREAVDSSLYQFYGIDNFDCKRTGTSYDRRDPKKQYYCGEMPVGEILPNGKKLLHKFTIKKQRQRPRGIRITTSKVTFPIYMSRIQNEGQFSLPWIQDLALTNLKTSSKLGDSVFTRYTPAGDSLFTSMCVSIPGVRIFTPKRRFVVRGNKKIFWFIRAKVKITTSLKLVDYKFDNINSCAILKVNSPKDLDTDIESLAASTVEVVDIMKPVVNGTRLKGLQIGRMHIRGNFVYRIIRFFGRIFGVKLDKMIAKELKSSLRKSYRSEIGKISFKNIAYRDIKRGTWAAKLADYYYSSLYAQINKRIVESLNRYNLETIQKESQVSLQKRRKQVCRRLTGFNVCEEVEALAPKLIPFYLDPEQKEEGCYDHFTPTKKIRGKENKWWRKGCSIKTVLSDE